MIASTGIPSWFLAVFIPLFVVGLVWAVLMLRRTGAAGAWAMITGRSSYRPGAAIWLGMAAIVIAAVTQQFWIAIVVIALVIVYTWWRFWGTTRGPQ